MAMVRLTSDAPELLLTEHLEGAQAILIFGVLLVVGGWTLHKAGLRALERRALAAGNHYSYG